MGLLKVDGVFTGVRALMNDQKNAVFTNEVQLEFFKMAYEQIRQACEEYSIPITLKTSGIIVVTAGVTNIGGPDGPSLPNDLIEPLDCWEIPSGTTNDYALMKRVTFLPKTNVITAFLQVWAWKEQYIHLLGASGDVSVKIDYVSVGMPDVVNENTIVQLTNAVNFLKFKTAAFCSMFIGENETRASALNDLAEDAKDTLLNIKIKPQQHMGVRRRPFMANYKRSGGYGR